MEPIKSFSLEKHSGPYASWPRKTRLHFNGADTGATVSGYVIDGQYRAGGSYVLILSYDCPFEESNDFLLLSASFEVIGESSLTPPMYGSYLLDTHWPVSASAIRMYYYHSEVYELRIEGRGLKVTQIHDYLNDERTADAVVNLQMRLAAVNAGDEGNTPTLDTWRRAWAELGATSCDDQTLRNLILAYEEPARAYHSHQHISECFEAFAKVSSAAQRSWEIRIALWFHDAVYDPNRNDNELRSAEWAKETATRFGVTHAVADRIHALVRATQHPQAVPSDPDQQVMIDVDLSILGAAWYRFAESEQQRRWEHREVLLPLFSQNRKAMLEEFLAREWIYNTPECRELYEQRARENLARFLTGGKPSTVVGRLLATVGSWYRRL